MVRCTYHCRACGSHFTSLEAFDAHHQGSGAYLVPCVFPDEAKLVERTGVCKLSGAETRAGIPPARTIAQQREQDRRLFELLRPPNTDDAA